MKVLITQRALVHSGGSEMVAIEMARGLAARGHQVSVFSPQLGDVAKLLLPGGVRAVDTLDRVPWRPEIIHAQHHLPAMAAIAYFDDAPAVYHCHGSKPWVEQPPLHDRIRRYVMMCPWMVQRVETEFALAPGRVTCVPNFVNTTRFSETRRPPAVVRKAVLFGGSGHSTEEIARLQASCDALGIMLDKIGGAYGNPRPRPEVFLQDYDLVFAIGKCALEAMATGCAVITLLPGQAGGLITSDTFDDCAFMNFGPRYFTSSAQIGETWLRGEISRYQPEGAAEITRRVRRDYDLEGALDAIEAVHETALAAGPVDRSSSFAPYLERLATEADRIWVASMDPPLLRQHILDLEQRLATADLRLSEAREELLAAARVKRLEEEAAQVKAHFWQRIVRRRTIH